MTDSRQPDAAAGRGVALATVADDGGALTARQEGLVLLHTLRDTAGALVDAVAVEVEGHGAGQALARALPGLTGRHEALRTRLLRRPDGWRRIVAGENGAQDLPLAVANLSSGGEPAAVVADFVATPVAPDGAWPWRAAVWTRAGDGGAIAVLQAHQVVLDRAGLELCMREWLATAAGNAGTGAPVAGEPPESADERAAVEHFRAALDGSVPLQLPTEGPRPAVFPHRGGCARLALSGELLAAVDAFARDAESSAEDVCLAAHAAVLARYGSQSDVVVGVGVRRVQPSADPLAAHDTLLPVRVAVDPDASFAEHCAAVAAAAAAARRHADVAVQALVSALTRGRDASRAPLFQAAFEWSDRAPPDRIGEWQGRWLPVPPGGATVDVALRVRRWHDGGEAELVYAAELFAPAFADRLLQSWSAALAAGVGAASQAVAELPLLAAEDRAFLATYNATTAPTPSWPSVSAWVLDVCERRGDAVALQCGEQRYTYAELARRARGFASFLIERGVGEGQLVGVCLPRTADTVVCVLGVLAAGAAYVPLDPTYPRERLEFTAADAGIGLLLTAGAVVDRLAGVQCERLLLDAEADAIEAAIAGPARALPAVGAEALAYVIYTSGSTGVPKGVTVPHGGVVNFLAAMLREPGLSADDTVLGITTLSFDIHVLELWATLVAGARLVVVPRAVATDGVRLAALIDDVGATVLQATPATFHMLVGADWRAPDCRVLCGGEAMPAELARALLERAAEVWNMYGPTEATVWCSCARIVDAAAPIQLGRPIANLQMHVLDPRRRPVPVGVAGELYIGGAGVCPGYHDRPELTAERFVADPFAGGDAVMYRTGDLARHTAHGLEFHGRVDNQVKLRGFRVELGEIEAALAALSAVSVCAVDVRSLRAGDSRLVAWLVGDGDTAGARAQLAERLPEYMVPQHWLWLPEMPLLPNGKIDRHALTLELGTAETNDAEQHTGVEAMVAQLWCEVLGLASVRRGDDFFALGGHSLLAAELVARINDTCGTRFDLGLVFDAPTLAAQAARIDLGEDVGSTLVVPLAGDEGQAPVFCVCGINLYRGLAGELADRHAVYGVLLPIETELLAQPGVVPSVVEMARGYADAVRQKQPNGPYRLVGVSFGGVLAYEVARQLRARGERVHIVAILDVLLETGRRSAARRLLRGLRAAWNGVAQRWRRRSATAVDLRARMENLRQLRAEVYDAAWERYDMQPYDGDVVVFRATDELVNYGADVPPDGGWRAWVRGELACHDVPGDHLGILEAPQVEVLARHLRAHL